MWDQSRLLAEYDVAGNRQQSYGYLEDDYVPTQLRNSNGTFYVHSDQLRTPKFVSDADAEVVWQAQHRAFGEALLTVQQDGQGAPLVVLNHRFPGQYFDSETGLHYNWQRYFDPRTGRYIESEPFGLAAGVNLVTYADNDPGMMIDPDGAQPRGPNPRNPRVPRGGNRNAPDVLEHAARRYREEQNLPPWLRDPPPGYDKSFKDNLENHFEEGLGREQRRQDDKEEERKPDPDDYPFPPKDDGVCRADDEERREEHERRKREWAESFRREWRPRCDWCW